MAVVKDNIITDGLSGMLGGKIVFRKMGDKTVVSTRPVNTAAPTDGQLAVRERFQEAVIYAKAAADDPATNAIYDPTAKKRKRTVYQVAVADFFKAPKINEVNLSDYKGQLGDVIMIRATDDFEVVKVEVEIVNPDGSVVETGLAVNQGNNVWKYTATQENDDLNGDRISIRAYDRPGNEGTAEEVLPDNGPDIEN